MNDNYAAGYHDAINASVAAIHQLCLKQRDIRVAIGLDDAETVVRALLAPGSGPVVIDVPCATVGAVPTR